MTGSTLNATMVPQQINDSLLKALGEMGPMQVYMNHSTEFCNQYKNRHWYCYLLLALYTLALPVGIVGNTAALLNYAYFRRTRTASSVLLLNLALCDSAWVLTLPFALYYNLRTPCASDIQAFCQLKKVSFNISIYGSILFLTLISFDRYAGAAHPIASLRWWGPEQARRCAFLAWVLLFIWSVPDLFLLFDTDRSAKDMACPMDHMLGPLAFVKAVSGVRTVLGFAVPFILILAFYTLTVRALRAMPWGGGKWQRGSKPLVLISAAVVVFVVSFVPYHVTVVTLVVMRAHGLVTETNASVLCAAYKLFEALCSLSCALNPLLYVLASERFQKGCRAFRRRPFRRFRSPRIGTDCQMP